MTEAARHPRTLRLGTRGSKLARWQAEWVADLRGVTLPDVGLKVVEDGRPLAATTLPATMSTAAGCRIGRASCCVRRGPYAARGQRTDRCSCG